MKNSLFSSLTYEKPNKEKLKKARLEARKELETEKAKRRDLHKTNRVAWVKYKAETKDKIQQLNAVFNNKND